MRASAWSVALAGIDGVPVEVEAAKGGGLPRTQLVGLPDKALSEAKERVKAAVVASGLTYPPQLVTINLSPASLPKMGSHYDVAIAAAILAAEGTVKTGLLAATVLLGELSLDGRIRRVRGVLPALLAASRAGFERAIVPTGQQAEAALVPGLIVHGAGRLEEVVQLLNGKPVDSPTQDEDPSWQEPAESTAQQPDLSDVMGHEDGRFALEVAAAGGHHLFLHGAPGVGKTMLASRLPSILPDLTLEESVEVSAVHSLAGRPLGSLISRPTFADPHHTVTPVALVGGGSGVLKPGAISLAHRGVLFLDESIDHINTFRCPIVLLSKYRGYQGYLPT